MSGRGRGRSGSRGGRGQGRRRNFERPGQKSPASSAGTRKERKSISDYIYYIGSAKQASDFSVIITYLINHIRKTFSNGNDIGDAIESKQPMNLDLVKPIMAEVTAIVTAKDGPLKEREQRIYDKECREVEMMYEAKIKSFVDRKQIYMNNLGKAYAFILGQCNKALLNKLYTRTDVRDQRRSNKIADGN